MISSRSHPRIRALAALRTGKGRREERQVLAEGLRLAREALRYAPVSALVVSESFLREERAGSLIKTARGRGAEVLEVSDSCYTKISDLKSPEGIAAVVRPREYAPDELLNGSARLLVAAGIQNPGNAGALVRVAEAAGASGCLFLEGVDLTHPRFIRAAMGGTFRLPCVAGEVGHFIEEAGRAGIRILAARAGTGSIDFSAADYSPPVAICVGGEGRGLPPEIERAADAAISIPMAAPVESLNAAVAAGIILYRAREAWSGERESRRH